MLERQTPPEYLTASEAAAYFHVSPKTIGRWAKEGRLPYLKTMGGHRRFRADDLQAIVESLTERPTS